MPNIYPNYIGERFGNLTVIEKLGCKNGHKTMVRCRCDCGNIKDVWIEHLKSGHTKSCGCYRKQYVSDKNTTHNLRYTRLYRIWLGMKARCYCKSQKGYKYYGGKGIEICEDWKNDFLKFYNWAMQNGYSDSLTIDRIDSDKNYEPSNCRWVTYYEQEHNKKRYKNASC